MAETLGGLLAQTRQRLRQAGYGEASLEARLLVEAATGQGWTAMVASPDRPVDAAASAVLAALVVRRLAGEPVFRILGRREFRGLSLALSPDTLEPRPDTETLVDLALQAIDGRPAPRILDLGTGTGAVALAILAARQDARAIATDIAAGAIATARANAIALSLGDRFDGRIADWFEGVDGRFDLIVSNPPYVRRSDLAGLAREVRDHDPARALDGGPDGLAAYRAIAAGAAGHLLEGAGVAVEIGHDQAADVSAVFAEAGFRRIAACRDLGGRDRALMFAPEPDSANKRLGNSGK